MYIDPSGHAAGAAIALTGAYFIPGIGQVLLIGTAIVVSGVAIYYAGSWIYKKAKDYIITAQNKNYQKEDFLIESEIVILIGIIKVLKKS